VRRLRLTATFALVSLVAMTALGAALVLVSSRLLEQQALLQAQRTAEAYARAGVEREVPESAYRTGSFSEALITRLDAEYGQSSGPSLVGIRLWTGDGVLVYDSTRVKNVPVPASSDIVEGGIPDPTRFVAATRLDGATSTAALVDVVAAGGKSTTRLDVYVPVFYGHSSPRTVAEILLSYDETAAAVANGTRTILYVALAGLGLLWLRCVSRRPRTPGWRCSTR
jgi:hypothetical protein